jgi:hypothetical protein
MPQEYDEDQYYDVYIYEDDENDDRVPNEGAEMDTSTIEGTPKDRSSERSESKSAKETYQTL